MKTTKWHKLGQKLGVEEFDLDVIEKDNPQNTEGALAAMLKKWLEITKDPTWRVIVDALEAIEENQLAKKLEIQYCPGIYVFHNFFTIPLLCPVLSQGVLEYMWVS